jgi:biopolymer transport protein ExbD
MMLVLVLLGCMMIAATFHTSRVISTLPQSTIAHSHDHMFFELS